MKKVLSFAALLLCAPVITVASPFPMGQIAQDANDGTPDIFDAVNVILGTSYTSNQQVWDAGLFVEPDYVWKMTSSDAQIALIGMTAGYTNELGIYTDLDVGQQRTSLISSGNHFGFKGLGSESNPFYESTILSLDANQQFGWYLNVNTDGIGDPSINPQLTYFSQPEMNHYPQWNETGWDHMMTFDLSAANGKEIWLTNNGVSSRYLLNNAYLITWEDLYQNHPQWWDWDYDDMMFLAGQVTPVPEPSSAMLIGLGLLSLAAFGLFRRKK